MTFVQTIEVTTYYLEMRDREALQPRRSNHAAWQLRCAERAGTINRDFYREVGRDWQWLDRSDWTDEQWNQYAKRPGLETWIASIRDEPAGYFELDDQGSQGVEIAYLGLLPASIGRGLGGPLLSAAIERAWQLGTSRVWVHTCTLDHPRALANYLARGMQIYQIETRPLAVV